MNKMPDPWFQATNTAMCISEFARPGNEPYRVAGHNERQLGPYVLPPFQRPAVWSQTQKTRLIESLWDGIPIGAYVFNMDEKNGPTDGWLLDGQQRITAILEYVSDAFHVYGYRFSELAKPEQRRFMQKSIGTLITRITSENACREVYDRLAYGGTAHEPKESLV